ncbi:outer membrane immunogenic protein [Sphingomonas jinjuensis]|uniref:Outer membrane immunogenic protein n=1 Tax=Sphingomonas jinjuensis TaxID=535907 RepID=A0A840FMR4_9SPHN|nr:outer membrane beta-barrel protein [Sphingomonas jinjuensis]MBB4154575.1 outer membrane immunogenic protein [Sphingomonas jinjuensis]
MRFMLIAGAAGLSALALPATAQETTQDQPFSGAYVGVAGGYDIQGNDVNSRILFDRNLDGRFNDPVRTSAGADAFSPGFCNGRALGATRAPGGCRNDRDGWNYYARVGADTQRGNVVVGAVGEFGKSEITDSVSAFSTTPANYVMTRSVDWEATIRGRAGLAFDTTLFYGTFGAGYARIDREFTSTNTANAFTGRGKRNQWGITGGGGIEQKLGRNFSIGMEYMYHQYNDNDYRVRVTQGTAPATNPFVLSPNTTGTDLARSDSKFRWHSIRGTAAFRF